MHQALFKARRRRWETPHPLNHEFIFIPLFLLFQKDMTVRTLPTTPITSAINMDLFSFFYLSQHLQGISMSFPAATHSLRSADSSAGQVGSSFSLKKKKIMFLINCNAKICVHMFYSFCDSILRMTSINRVLDLSNLGIKPFISKLSIKRKRKHLILFSNMKPFHWQATPALSVPLLQLLAILTFSLD